MSTSDFCNPRRLLPYGRVLRSVVVLLVCVGVRTVRGREERIEFSDKRIDWYPELTKLETDGEGCSDSKSSWHAVSSSDEEPFQVRTCDCTANATVRFRGSAFKLIMDGGGYDKLSFKRNGTTLGHTFSLDDSNAGVFALNNLDNSDHVIGIHLNCNATKLAIPMTFKSMTVDTQESKSGVIAGAVVGAAVGSFIITILAWILFRRYTHRNQKLFSLKEPPENRIDPLVFPHQSRPPKRRIRGISRAGTSTFSRLHSIRFRDGLPHFRAPPSHNPPSTIEAANIATSPVTMPISPTQCRLTTTLSRHSHRVSAPPPPKRMTQPASIRETYEVTPFTFPQNSLQGAPERNAAKGGVDVPPLHVQTQLEMHAKRMETYTDDKVLPEANVELPVTLPTLPQHAVNHEATDQPRQTVGQRRAFFVVNKSSTSTLRSSGVPPAASGQQVQKSAIISNSLDEEEEQEELAIPRGLTVRKWQKSRALPRIDDNIEEEAPASSRPLIDDMEPTLSAPPFKKTGAWVFFTTNPSSLSSSSISSRTVSQARKYITRKRRKDETEPAGDDIDVINSASLQASAAVNPQSKQMEEIDPLPASTPARRVAARTRGVLIDAPVSLHMVTPQSRNNAQLDLNASTGGIPSTVSAGLSDERAEDFEFESSSGHQSSINRHREARRSLSPVAAAEMGALARGVSGGRGRQRRGSKTVFFATNPSTISEPSIISGEAELSTEGNEETRRSREEAIISPLSDVSSMPRLRLDKGKARALY